MSINNLSPAKEDLEQLFKSVNDTLELLITQYRTLYINHPDNPLRERIGDFCAELEGLRKKISDPSQPLATRIECVGNVTQYIQDLVHDVGDYKTEDTSETLANEFIHATDRLEELIGIKIDEAAAIEDVILQNPQASNTNYFSSKQAELKKILAEHPEVT